MEAGYQLGGHCCNIDKRYILLPFREAAVKELRSGQILRVEPTGFSGSWIWIKRDREAPSVHAFMIFGLSN